MDLKKLTALGKLQIPPTPLMFFLDLTTRCNLQCWFCYNELSRSKENVSLKTAKNILDEMHKAHCDEVMYLGGEPTLHPCLFEILSYADSLNMKQSLITNGQVIDIPLAKNLAKIKTLEVGISIHSCYSSVHNAITASSRSFDNIERAVHAFEKTGVTWYSQTSLIKSNYLDVKNLHSYLLELGSPARMDLSRMVVGNQNTNDFLDAMDYAKVFEQINGLDLQKLPVRIEAFPRCWLLKISKKYSLNYEKIKKSVRPCYAWIGQVSIDIHGNVRLCPTGGKIAGNVVSEGIEHLWTNDIIREYQNFQWQHPECLKCADFAFCLGACKMSCGKLSPSPDIYIVEGGMNNAYFTS